jgi:hypothetical protein
MGRKGAVSEGQLPDLVMSKDCNERNLGVSSSQTAVFVYDRHTYPRNGVPVLSQNIYQSGLQLLVWPTP